MKTEKQKKHSSTTSKHPELKHTADVVVKYLTPYYKSGKITSKVCKQLYICNHPELKITADLVVKYLTRYDKSGKITSKVHM